MARKTVSLPESVYNDLDGENREGESFADTIRRLLNAETADGVTNAELLNRLDDVAATLPRETADVLEHRFR